MVVINPNTGLRFDGVESHGDSLLFKTAEDYYAFIMRNPDFMNMYYNREDYRNAVNKVIGALSD